MVHWPDSEGPFPSAVVCHPHPLFGGDMDNNVVTSVADKLANSGIVTIRFNFRGVGDSEGSYDDGAGEQEDVRAAIDFLHGQPQVDSRKTAVVGYSFGAFVGLAAALTDHRVSVVAGISPPLNLFDFAFMKNYTMPKLLVSGQRDDFTPSNQFQAWADELPEPKKVEVIALANHFWLGYEQRISDLVAMYLKSYLK
jgi:alpha/beta superfamily hydrolase